jgi:hypothetical protein
VQEMPGADSASLGATSFEVDGISSQPSDDTRGSLRDLVMREASFGVPGALPRMMRPQPSGP